MFIPSLLCDSLLCLPPEEREHSRLTLTPLLTPLHFLPIQGACLVRVPTELVKTRAQTSAYGPLTSSLYSARMVLHTDGLKGFYRGFGITVMREVSHFHS
jgi:hypothetical protein